MADDPQKPATETRPSERYDIGERGGYSPSEVVSLNSLNGPSASPAPGTPLAPAPVMAAPAEGSN